MLVEVAVSPLAMLISFMLIALPNLCLVSNPGKMLQNYIYCYIKRVNYNFRSLFSGVIEDLLQLLLGEMITVLNLIYNFFIKKVIDSLP